MARHRSNSKAVCAHETCKSKRLLDRNSKAWQVCQYQLKKARRKKGKKPSAGNRVLKHFQNENPQWQTQRNPASPRSSVWFTHSSAASPSLGETQMSEHLHLAFYALQKGSTGEGTHPRDAACSALLQNPTHLGTLPPTSKNSWHSRTFPAQL